MSASFNELYQKFKKTPALTAGLVVFTFFLCVLKTTFGVTFQSLILYPRSPLDLNLNAISLYSLVHIGYLHWLFNILSIFTPLALFEKRHGTVYTGITLNLLTVIAAVQYCIVGLVFYPETGVAGLSGIAFSFFAYMAYQEHKFKPVMESFNIGSVEIKIYTLSIPFIVALVFMIIFPASSLPGHLAGISTGFLLAMGYINKLYPPSSVILKIEQWVAPGINLLGPIVTYYKEEDALHVRNVGYTPLLVDDIESLATASSSSGITSVGGNVQASSGLAVPPTRASRSSSYVRESRVLGEA
ncbi:rhomboid protein 2 [Lodderomyces elongisporus NRRL YB-4239]|uniref:Rhomboid-type serine protease 2 n=1 Tax=Lodderomyces elongisporus (strain ATCC 11503 / CBS 2605 / JCM 1781 / NBRC 1676 / NRRL YB-4239) TaxID=379508 RepID=A5E613_LODEL|nr:rhomboid protein 2 [Lodderomyces elongisporus NRRL YB-4239]